MTKKNISIAVLVLMILTNVYLIWRVNSNTMTIASYDAGISQRTGVGKLESYWTKYIGGSKNAATTYEDRLNAENDSTYSIIALVLLDIVFVAVIFKLNKKPKPAKVQLTPEEEWERERRAINRRHR